MVTEVLLLPDIGAHIGIKWDSVNPIVEPGIYDKNLFT